MISTIRMYLAVAAVLSFALSGCSDPSQSKPSTAGPSAYPYKVATTVGMITDIVKNVAGDKATVEGIMQGDTDPHTYTPGRNDTIAFQNADVIFYNGLMLEGKMTDIFVKMAAKKKVVAVTEMLSDEKTGDASYVMSDEAEHYDPHVWMDVQGWIRAVRAVTKALSEYDAKNAAYYEANAAAYLKKLEALDVYAKQVIGSIPQNKRVLITAHDAFNYMGRAYGLKVMGVQGISTESEAGLKRINDLVDFIVTNQIAAVFVEASVSEKNVTALVEGAASRGHAVKIGGKLFSDSMGAEGTYEGTYIGMIDHNVSTIARALGGSVPEGGFKGQGLGAKGQGN
ncbi:MAG: zinc ABC transporter substrate-binding protein [Phycisphaeraceae bacterium]